MQNVQGNNFPLQSSIVEIQMNRTARKRLKMGPKSITLLLSDCKPFLKKEAKLNVLCVPVIHGQENPVVFLYELTVREGDFGDPMLLNLS